MNEYNLTFDGYKISLRQNNITIKSWDAISGRPGQQLRVSQIPGQ